MGLKTQETMSAPNTDRDESNINESHSIASFIEIVNNVIRSNGTLNPMSDKTALKFLIARKFDVARAIDLYRSHEITRFREGLATIDSNDQILKAELDSGKFTVLSCRDPHNSTISVFTAKLHKPDKSNRSSDVRHTINRYTLQGIVYQLDAALEDLTTQKNGIVFIYNMTDSDMSNFDLELCEKILNLLKGAYPAKLKKVLVVGSPMWFKFAFQVLSVIVKKKLRERVELLSVSQLQKHIPVESLPPELGGVHHHDHEAWLARCENLHKNRMNDLCDPDFADTIKSSHNNELQHTRASSNVTLNTSVSSTSTVPNEQAPQLNNETNSSANRNFGLTLNFDLPRIDMSRIPKCPAFNNHSMKPVDRIIDKPLIYDYDDNGMSITQFIDMIKTVGMKGLSQEYLSIVENERTGTFVASTHNIRKNRYINVKCYDHSRVILEPHDTSVEADPNSDYINANYVDGYRQKHAYISTQGPTESTIVDFWRMIWQTNSRVIAMVTLNIEHLMIKCDRYWPSSDDRILIAGVYTVEYVGVDYCEDYIVTQLKVTDTRTEAKRDIWHMQFTSWPDFGTPVTATALLKYRQDVLKRQLEAIEQAGCDSTYPPIVVHCSAGVGRSGTFITIDICIQKLETTGLIDIKGVVEKLREQRYLSIQTDDQYIFCYRSVFEYASNCGLVDGEELNELFG